MNLDRIKRWCEWIRREASMAPGAVDFRVAADIEALMTDYISLKSENSILTDALKAAHRLIAIDCPVDCEKRRGDGVTA